MPVRRVSVAAAREPRNDSATQDAIYRQRLQQSRAIRRAAVPVARESTLRRTKPVYVVRPGDTLYGIARRYGIEPRTLAAVNALKPPYTLAVGQRLRLSAVGSISAARRTDKGMAALTLGKKPVKAGKSRSELASATGRKAALPAPPPRSSGRFAWPVHGALISRYGPKTGGLYNDGINIAAAPGTPVLAAENGVVAYAGNEIRGFGNLVLVRHAGGWSTAYAHNSRILVKRGDRVAKGQMIARVGRTGSVDKPQLNFQIRKGTRAFDPLEYLESPRRLARAN